MIKQCDKLVRVTRQIYLADVLQRLEIDDRVPTHVGGGITIQSEAKRAPRTAATDAAEPSSGASL